MMRTKHVRNYILLKNRQEDFCPFYHCCLSAHICLFYIPYLHLDFVISSHIPQLYYFPSPTQSSSASCAMLMRPNKVETVVHGCWLLRSIYTFFLVATGIYPFYHCRLSAHACSFNICYLHLKLCTSCLFYLGHAKHDCIVMEKHVVAWTQNLHRQKS